MKKIALVLAVALAVPATAAAKGPASGSITGPGLDRPIQLTGLGEPGSVGTLGRVAAEGGLFAALSGSPSEWGTLVDERPSGDLGPRYTAWFVMRDVSKRTVRIELYPYTDALPVTYVPRGQKPFGTAAMDGGWFVADEQLKATLVEAGLPPHPPSAVDDGFEVPQPTVLAPAIVAAVALMTAAAFVLRRRLLTAR
jgi:hypothetical protein